MCWILIYLFEFMDTQRNKFVLFVFLKKKKKKHSGKPTRPRAGSATSSWRPSASARTRASTPRLRPRGARRSRAPSGTCSATRSARARCAGRASSRTSSRSASGRSSSERSARRAKRIGTCLDGPRGRGRGVVVVVFILFWISVANFGFVCLPGNFDSHQKKK
jgi:hypothetical protein